VAKAGAGSRTVTEAPPAKAAPARGKAAEAEPAPSRTTKAKAAEAAPARPAARSTKAEPKPAKAEPETKTKHAAEPKADAKPAETTKPTGESKLSAKTLEKLRKTLTDERDVILRQAAALEAEAEQLAADRDGGDTQFDEESGEGDSLNIERERDLMLSAHARHTLEEIDAALARMDAGTYGICEVSGKPIPVERLEAIPWARVRAEVQAKRERRR
jgi:RNA polymerase-binding transcription factor DksA